MTKDVHLADFSHYSLYDKCGWKVAINIMATSLIIQVVKILSLCVFKQLVMVCNDEAHDVTDMTVLIGEVC